MTESLITQHIDLWTSAIEAKSTAGRGSKNKFDLYGIKKLRELILELAVRGKLVPQDPTDKPASVLLERIAAEKKQLIKDKKIKKTSDYPEVTNDEIPFELPEGWVWLRLGDCGYTQTGGTPSKTNPAFFGNEIPFIKPADIEKNFVNYKNEGLSLLGADNLGRVAPAGSILMVCIGTIGKCGYIDRSCSFNQQINSLSPYLNQTQFLCLTLSSCYFQKLAWEQSSKTTIAILNKGKWELLPIPLPPENEQLRIVAKVGELMALCDQLEQQTLTSIDAHATLVETLLETLTNSADATELEQNWVRISEHFDTLFTTEQSIDTLKQTILQLAVMGKLVRQDPTDEPASVLLEKIAAEKAQLIKDKKIKKEKPLPPISDDEKPFELPQGWEWCRVWDIAHTITSGSRDWAKYYSDTGAKFITMGNLSRGDYKLRMDTIRYVNPPNDGEGLRTKLEANDLLISITGDVGNLGLIPIDFGDAYINQHTCMLRFITPCRNLFFPNMMRSPWAKYQFDAPQRGIKNSFRLGDVGEMLIPLPPLEEQYRIVDKIEKLLSLCESIKWKLNKSISIQLHLTDAIVDKALS